MPVMSDWGRTKTDRGYRTIDSHSAPSAGSIATDVQNIYARAGLEPGDDPADLAACLGLDPCPSDCREARLDEDGTTLRYPGHLFGEARGMALFPVIASFIAEALNIIPSPAGLARIMDELILPKRIAERTSFSLLREVQPHASIETLSRIFMGYHSSGSMPAVG